MGEEEGNIGILEYWKIGEMEYWNIGILEFGVYHDSSFPLFQLDSWIS
jgi:hypothetical protein